MCRRLCLLDQDLIIEIMDEHLPFRCATFKCSCVTPNCKRCYNAVLRPCKKHGNYTCKVCCKDEDKSNIEIRPLDVESSDSVPERPRQRPNFHSLQDWGLTDAQFEEVMRIYKASIGGMTALRERSYRLSRQCQGSIPSDFYDDIERVNTGGNLEQSFLFKFLDAYYQVIRPR